MSVIIFTGRLGGEPEVRYTQTGTAVLALSVADTRYWFDKKEQVMKNETDWHRVIVWGERAERLAESAGKGDLMEIHGELRYRQFDGEKGEKVRLAEIHATRARVIARADANKTGSALSPHDDGVPLPEMGGNYDNFSDDDIPY